MRATIACALVSGLLLASAAPGGTVHMRDGRKFVGKVTKKANTYQIEMTLGTITVDAADVLYVLEGGKAEPIRATTRPAVARPAVRLRPQRPWDLNRATRPEPIVFMLTRQLELLGGDSAAELAQRQLGQWKEVLHDGKRKVGETWLSREDQHRRRQEFERRAAAARKLAGEFRRYARSRVPAEQAKARTLEMEFIQKLHMAAAVWPDAVIREFLAGTLDLRARNYERAEKRFESCIDADPLVAAYHQGRGVALIGLGRHLEALEEFIACVELRDDGYLGLQLLREAMRVTPGAKIGTGVYARAKELLGRYEQPQRTSPAYGRGLAWLMPGRRPWQARDETIFTPPYDRLVGRQALAIPLTDDTLVADADAVAGAELMYVQAGPDRVVMAEAMRTYSYSPGKSAVPLAVLHTSGVEFTPVEMAQPAALKAGQTVSIQAVNLYRQMGSEIRSATAKVAPGQEGVTLSQTLLPGEAVGAVFAGESFAGLLTARGKVDEPGCGVSTFLAPAELTGWVARMKKTLAGRAGSARYGTLKRKADAEKTTIQGRVFLLHILSGEMPPKEFGK